MKECRFIAASGMLGVGLARTALRKPSNGPPFRTIEAEAKRWAKLAQEANIRAE